MARTICRFIIDVLTIIIVAVIVLLAVHLVRADAEQLSKHECLNSAQAVWDAHPRSHATWNLVDGRECWRVGYGKRREVMRNERRSSMRSSAAAADVRRHDTTPRPLTPAGAIPLPRPRLEAMITPHFSLEEEHAMNRLLMRQLLFGAQ